MLKTLATKLKEIAVIWGTLSGFIIAFIAWYDANENYFSLYASELVIIALTLLISFIVWLSLIFRTDKLSSKLDNHQNITEKTFKTIEIALLKADIDRFFNEHEHQDLLTEDEMKYVYMLQEKLDYYELNSFNKRKLDVLLLKEIVAAHDIAEAIKAGKK